VGALAAGEPAADPEADARWKKAAAESAKAYEKLHGLEHDAKADARFDGYLVKALELEPSKARIAKVTSLAKQAAGNKTRADFVGRLLVRLREVDAEGAGKGRYDALEAELAQADVALVKGDHPMVGWVSLPKGWAPKQEWRVLVTVDGSGSNFLGSARTFRDARGSRKFVVLAPCSLSNTNELEAAKYPFYSEALRKEWGGRRVEFDLAGLQALLKAVHDRFGGAETIAITGFSGGGNLCYSMTMHHPDRVWAAAPACANYQPGLAQGAKAVEGGGPPVHILTGEKDEHRDQVFGQTPGIEGQSDWAQESFAKLGFRNVKRTMIPGAGHSSLPQQVWAFFDEVLEAKAR
jgi:predicted esterase